jgi:hypothetical protein
MLNNNKGMNIFPVFKKKIERGLAIWELEGHGHPSAYK